jgi:hypothetical protein
LKKTTKVDISASFYLLISFLGLILLAILTYSQTVLKTEFPWQKPLAGSIFNIICILGIIAGLSPNKCSRVTHFKTTAKSSFQATKRDSNEASSITFRGHHPTCDSFASHILSFRNQIFCAGCTGLVIGGIVSLAGSFLYFFVGLQISGANMLIFWLGFLGVMFGLLQYKIPINNGYAHFMINVIFVLGAFFLLVGINSINESLSLDLYLIALSVYWILTRIELSRQEHRKKCADCGLKPCSLSFDS